MPEIGEIVAGVRGEPPLVKVRYTKWDGSLHWHFDMDLLGRDEHGTWLGSVVDRPLRKGTDPAVFRSDRFAGLVPDEGDWIAFWNERSRFEVYIDVCSTPVWDGATVSAVDLDLDVVRWRDARVEVIDEDEFELHQVRYGYPPEVVLRARETADQLAKQVAARQEPFGATGAWWLGHLTGRLR